MDSSAFFEVSSVYPHHVHGLHLTEHLQIKELITFFRPNIKFFSIREKMYINFKSQNYVHVGENFFLNSFTDKTLHFIGELT